MILPPSDSMTSMLIILAMFQGHFNYGLDNDRNYSLCFLRYSKLADSRHLSQTKHCSRSLITNNEILCISQLHSIQLMSFYVETRFCPHVQCRIQNWNEIYQTKGHFHVIYVVLKNQYKNRHLRRYF